MAGKAAFAVNLDPTESRTGPLPIDEFERLGAPVAHHIAALTSEVQKKIRLQNADLENRQKLWRWFILATLSLLLVETYLAGRATRRSTKTGEEPIAQPELVTPN